jgi:hypothetical protein
MNKLYRLPLRTRPKNLSSGVRRRRNSSKILATVILALSALAALGAIGFGAFFTLKHLRTKPKVIAAAVPSPTAMPDVKKKDLLMPLADPNQSPPGGNGSGQPAPNVPSAPLVLSSIPVSTPPVSVAQEEQKTDSHTGAPDKTLSKIARKNLEKKRLEVERKRARLEQAYQKHEISIDAYNKGKEEYKNEIQKYRNELKSGT